MQRPRVPVPSWLNRSVSDVPSKLSPRLFSAHGSQSPPGDRSRFSRSKLQTRTLANAKHQKTWGHLEI